MLLICIAVVILLLHVALALTHMAIVVVEGRSSDTLSSIGETLAPVINSTPYESPKGSIMTTEFYACGNLDIAFSWPSETSSAS
jgi:hypothetical protein